jgi:rSAM/selenodomain-associated transferase 1
MPDRDCVILFVKLPEKGKVKSRLARQLDEDIVLRLYEYMVLDAIDVLNAGHYPFRISYTPPGAGDLMRNWLGCDYSYMPQVGKDLGESMEQTFLNVFAQEVDKAVIIGSDVPGVSTAIIDEAFEALSMHDSVIGPASDGGYYLIGFRNCSLCPDIFHHMKWSTADVYEETMRRLQHENRSVHILPELADLDRREDLIALLRQRHDYDGYFSRTMQYLNSIRSSILD